MTVSGKETLHNGAVSTPICDFLRDYAASGISRFHMPGHKGTCDSAVFASDVPQFPYAWDITEISGADSLYDASGIILESENNASRLFGTEATFYSTEGSSHCIRAMLALATRFCPQDSSGSSSASHRPVILAARNAHRSFLTACALLDLDVEWLFSETDSYSLCSCTVSAQQIRLSIESLPQKPAAVFLTSPDYLGNLQDIRSIADAVHVYGVPLLVDNAHGAYLHFLENPLHPMDLGADMCCDSAHKTLPALTGCAYLHIGGPLSMLRKGFRDHARRALSLFGSTSPSYLLLASLDQLNALLADSYPRQIKACEEQVRSLRSRLSMLGWKFLPADHSNQEPLKITIDPHSQGFTGRMLADRLRTCGIECEYADPDALVLMVSPRNTRDDYQRLYAAFESISQAAKDPADANPADATDMIAGSSLFEAVSTSASNTSGFYLPHPEKVLSIREALLTPPEILPAEKAIGRICGDCAISCPPAIPILVAGERITQDMLPVFRHYGLEQVSVLPVSDRPGS